MTTRAKFEALAALHGIAVDYRPGGTVRRGPLRGERFAAEIMLDAPHGKIFATSDCHCDGSLNHDIDEDGTRTDWPGAYAGLKQIIAHGLRDCPDGLDCDICNPPTENDQ